jgi:MoaA/NifB/PqqE/SkfB family radical SAM enzyme
MDNLIKIESTQPNDVLTITWSVSNVCNFKCRYCWPGAHDGDHPAPKDLDLVIKNMDHMLTQYKEKLGKSRVRIILAGGEPTLWRGLERVIKELKDRHEIYATIVSNGSRTLRWWKEYGHLFDNVQISHHIAEADLAHTIKVADTIYEAGSKMTVRIMMDAAHWDQGLKDLEYMKAHSKHKWFIDVAEVIEDYLPVKSIPILQEGGRVYTPDQRKYLQKQRRRIPNVWWIIKNFKLFLEGKLQTYESTATYDSGKRIKAEPNYYTNRHLNNFLGWSCDIGLETVFINWNGDVKGSCGQILFGLDKHPNILEDEFTATFNPEFKPSICEWANCFCGPEIHASKFKI